MKNNILISPLEWGLGHATRIIPLARMLADMGQKVFIAAGDKLLPLLKNELPGIAIIRLSGFSPGYSAYLPQYIPLLLKTPSLIYHTIREHFILKKIIRDYKISIVISDNRFGLWNKNIKSVYITHMPRIPFPGPFRFLEFIGIMLHRHIIKKYSLCFIPDLPGELNLSGRLTHDLKLPDNVRYIGILSRFLYEKDTTNIAGADIPFNILILSGPEPQRGILKEKYIKLLDVNSIHNVILEGNPVLGIMPHKTGNITFYPHMPSEMIADYLRKSKMVVTRSGYTTIMELISLNCSALLIPTPGQTEQEYLADYLSEKGWFSSIKQKELSSIPKPGDKYIMSADEINRQSKILLKDALSELLEKPEV